MMTRSEAEAFIDRNPRLAETLRDRRQVELIAANADALYRFGGASNEADATVNLVEVCMALL